MRGIILGAAATLIGASAWADTPTVGLGGLPGVIDVPTARPWADGRTALSAELTQHGSAIGIGFQLAPRIAASFALAHADDQDTAPTFGLRFNLLEETAQMPALAVGATGLYGTGARAGAYIVASKQLGAGLEVSGGLGWGAFANAAPDIGAADWRGPDLEEAAPFAGLSWQPQGSGWRLKAEYVGGSGAGRGLDLDQRMNFGIERRIGAGVDAGLYALGGREIALRLTFAGTPDRPNIMQDFAPGPVPLRPRATPPTSGWAKAPGMAAKIAEALKAPLGAEGVRLEALQIEDQRVQLAVRNLKRNRPSKALGRTARVLAAALPPSVEQFDLTLVEDDLPVTTLSLKRSALEQLDGTFDAGPSLHALSKMQDGAWPQGWRNDAAPRLSYGLAPRLPVGASGDKMAFDLQLAAQARYRLAPGLSVQGVLTQSLFGSDAGTLAAQGDLPRVRSHRGAYHSDLPVLERLTVNYRTKLAPTLYARASVGVIERMYSGVAAELLWHETGAPLSAGLELAWVQQRDPDEFIGLNDYDTVTGLGTLYWDSGWHGVSARLAAGRYLAGDWGGELRLGRRFANGWEVAGTLTATEHSQGAMPSAELTIPLQWTTPYPTRQTLSVSLSDLGRDAGARLDSGAGLFDQIRNADARNITRNWEGIWQ